MGGRGAGWALDPACPAAPPPTYGRHVYATAAAPPAARGLLFATAAVWLFFELRQATNSRADAVRHDRGSRLVLRFAVLVGVVLTVALPRWVPGATIRPVALVVWIGLVLVWCGVALRIWSFRTLGRYFTFTVQTSDDQPVITSGPYRVLRHPGYAGIVLAVIGLGLFTRNYLSLVALTVAVTCGLVYRIQVEEQALVAALGEKYRRYAESHRRLVPFIW